MLAWLFYVIEHHTGWFLLAQWIVTVLFLMVFLPEPDVLAGHQIRYSPFPDARTAGLVR